MQLRDVGLSVCAAGVLTGSVGSNAYAEAASGPNRTVNINYVYAAELGFGGYSLSGLTASVYELPLYYSLHMAPGDAWGLKLLAPLQLGIYSLNVTDTDGTRISIKEQSIALVPGLELEIPVGSRTVVKPFGQFGVGHTFGLDTGSPNAYIYMTGVRAVSQWQVSSTAISVGNALIYAGNAPIGSGFSEHYVSLQLGVEVRHPLGFSVGGLTPDVGVHSIYYNYPSPLVFSRFLLPELRIQNQGEIGLSFGSATPFRLLGMSNPRLGAGIIFGDGLTVWRVYFAFPF
jgi:hypothetical protein